MDKWLLLSHQYETSTPGFGGAQGFFREEQSSIAKGRNSNSEKWTISNHLGTHVDCPYHFDLNGKKLTDYTSDNWIFRKPHLIQLEAAENEIIELNLERENIPNDADILIIKTSFEKFRAHDQYWKNNPGLAPALGRWLKEHRPNITTVGFDFISLTAFSFREIGKEAHLAFLTNGIRIIEDMKLSSLSATPKMLIVSPLMVKDADGGPVTVWAQF